MIAYGHEWPDETSDAQIHLWCYRHHDQRNKSMLAKHVHFELAIKALWPEILPSGKKGYVWNEWSYRRLYAWCYHDFQTWWGPSSSGKSTDAGVFALAHWYSAPDQTTITVCSTTKDMLERRIWREIIRFHTMLDGRVPGAHLRSKHCIQLEDPTSRDGENTINAIFAVAVQKGTTQEAVGNLVGLHNDYNVLIIDEMQATREAAVEAFDNLSTGKESKFLGMGNPSDRKDPLVKASEPKHGNWDLISPELEEWETKKGVCLYFDGLKSPGVRDPKKFWYLLTQKQIESMAVDPGRDSPRFWSQRRGFCPPDGLVEAVLSYSFIEKFQMARSDVRWRDSYITVAGLDPSFSSGGDRCVLQLAQLGQFDTGQMGLKFLPPNLINMKITAKEPLTFQLALDVIKILNAHGVDIKHLGVDCTGAQRAVADIIDRETRRKCHRVIFSQKASDMRISLGDNTPACEVYRNKVTELWYQVREFGQAGQVAGLSKDAIDDFTMRHLISSGSTSALICIESKDDMKERTGGRSPDYGDAASILVDVVRSRLRVFAGVSGSVRKAARTSIVTNPYDMNEREDSYTGSDV